MTVVAEIPDDLAHTIASTGQDPAQAALEALALEGYRQRWLSEAGIRRLLGFETRMKVHEFLKQHGVYLHYGLEDWEHDMREADRYFALKRDVLST
jgi:hypothetical protein